MTSKIIIKSLLGLIVVLSSCLQAQNCKLDITPVSPEILEKNNIKEIRVFKIDVKGDKIKFQNFFIDESGGCNKQYFYVDANKSDNPIVSECTYDSKKMCSSFSKRLNVNGSKKNILSDDEYYGVNGKLLKKITIEGDEIIQKTILLINPNNSSLEEKRFYKISVKDNDTLTKVVNIKSERKHTYYLINKTGNGKNTERSETVFETPTSGTVKVWRNEKLINEYEFGKEKTLKKHTEEVGQPYGLPYSEAATTKIYTNDDKTFAPSKNVESCKYLVLVKKHSGGTVTSLIYDNKTKLLMKEVNTYKEKNIEGREYEYVKK